MKLEILLLILNTLIFIKTFMKLGVSSGNPQYRFQTFKELKLFFILELLIIINLFLGIVILQYILLIVEIIFYIKNIYSGISLIRWNYNNKTSILRIIDLFIHGFIY